MKICRFSSLALVFLISLLTSPALADIVIGNGFTCNGTSILKGTKTVKYSKAKSNLTKTIETLKSQLETASDKQKQRIKNKIKVARSSKTLLKSCSEGTLTQGPIDPIFSQLSSGKGKFIGDYSGSADTLLGTFPLEGTVQFQFALSGSLFTAILTLEGNLGTTLNSTPLTFVGDLSGVTLPAQFNLADTFLGSVTLTLGSDGRLVITNVDSKSDVKLDSKFSGQSINGSLNGTYKGNSFQGSFNLKRQ